MFQNYLLTIKRRINAAKLVDPWTFYHRTGYMPESRRAPWEFPYTADEFLKYWRTKIPVRLKTYPPNDRTAEEEVILAVDASGKLSGNCGGAGVMFLPKSKIGRCYRMRFWDDLGIHINDGDSAEFEMLNLLFSFCLFKEILVNKKKIRILFDNDRIQTKENDQIADSIKKVIEYLKSEGAKITNDLDGSYDLHPLGTLEVRLVGVADRISKDKPIPEFKDHYDILKGNYFHELGPHLNKKYRRFFSDKFTS